MFKFLWLNSCLRKSFIFALAILASACWFTMTVQAAGVNPLLQGMSDNPSVYGTGLMSDEVTFKEGKAVVIEEYGNGRARAAYFAGYIPPGAFAYRAMRIEGGHLIINGYDCQLFNGQAHPLFYKQYDVDLNKRQWRVCVMHKIDIKTWNIYRMDCVPEDQSYVPMADHVWKTIMQLVPSDVISEMRSGQ